MSKKGWDLTLKTLTFLINVIERYVVQFYYAIIYVLLYLYYNEVCVYFPFCRPALLNIFS